MRAYTPRKRIVVTGGTGQDGGFLTDFLFGKGYEVHGIKRRTSLFNTDRIDHLHQDPHEKNGSTIPQAQPKAVDE